ncbi:porin [Rubrolithibacter danxiaensis]|uniref:porin n=1 Tax=Rubrolithibacter danxiaensis TaxID=3390805 RepID=UPI003BF77DC5
MKLILIKTTLFSLVLWVAATVSKAQQQNEDLLNLLIQKGTLTQEEADSLRAEWALKAQDQKEKQTKFNLSTSKALQLSGYIQGRYQVQDEKGKIDGFDIRRARLDLRGTISEHWDYRLQVDFAGTPKLLDGIITYKNSDFFKISAGQFKIPISYENLMGSQKLETIDRSQVVEALVARGKDVIGNHNGRDIGVQLNGSFVKLENNYLFDYAIGIFDGAGINTTDNNEKKDFAGRLTIHPLSGLDISANYYNGLGKWAASNTAQPVSRGRERVGFDVHYLRGPLSLTGEYIKGKDADSKKEGWYAQAAVFVFPKKVQLVAKYDDFDPNTAVAQDISHWYIGGLNYFFTNWSKLQVNYTVKDEQALETHNNLLSAQLTLQF